MIESTGELHITPVAPAMGRCPAAPGRVAELINGVYAVAEDGMWKHGATRTTTAEITELAEADQIFVARLEGRIVGCVRLVPLADRVAEFGMLAADPQLRGVGIGRALVHFAENHAAETGSDIMALEVIQPRDFSLPSKEFLTGWYTRMGYRAVRTDASETVYPALTPLLKVPCVVVTYRKNLRV
ncbi:GNAT family N-acetyltransferase [Rhodococcus sp. NPDC059968]|uniref:GNAT family N-acetyltransferase n=1 Tax=Rhodococcus sp. NPDC059968 TaxID=3347017 RepID=UPI0036709914